ncbi:MAG: protease modulator HflC, partial [Chloroflexi bacterium]|nr:protease modulator HflC [Chloroflexota bacterium]
MKFIAAILVLVVILLAVIGPQIFFVVDETQLAIVTRFGEPRQTITNPGLNTKTPFVDTVVYFDKRLLLFDAPPDALLTKDKKTLIIDVFARGRIVDPLTFFRTVRTVAVAQDRVISIVSSELRREIANDDQSEIIEATREIIMNRVREAVKPAVSEFGIEILDVRIKRADFPDAIADSIYDRMRAERSRLANQDRAEGAEESLQIRAEADREVVELTSEAQKNAQIVRGQAEAEAIRIFADALELDPEFYAFQRSLDAYKIFLTQNTTIVLPANSDLFQFLQSPNGLNGGNG